MKIKVLSAAIVAFCFASMCTSLASAVDGGSTLQLSPVRQALSVSPGKSGQVTLTLSNPTKQTVTLQAVVEDFTTFDADGTPALIDPSVAGGRSFKQFVQPLRPITVAPGADTEVKVQVAVSQDATPGGYYGAIRFTPTGDASSKAVTASAASLVLLTVPGNVKEAVSLDGFAVSMKVPTFSIYWLGGGSATVHLSFHNQGDVHEAPIGQLYVKRGSELVSKVDFNQTQPRSYILPGSHRLWQTKLDIPDEFGRYTITGTFSYGSKNQTIEVNQTYWVIPVWYVAGAGIGLLLVCLLVIAVGLKRPFTKRRRL